MHDLTWNNRIIPCAAFAPVLAERGGVADQTSLLGVCGLRVIKQRRA